MNDFWKARARRPGATVMAINRAAQFILCDLLFSPHPQNIDNWKRLQIKMFDKADFTCHSGRPLAGRINADFPAVDHWWPGAVGSGASAWGGARVALFMGFDEVVLCGMRLQPANRANQKPS